MERTSWSSNEMAAVAGLVAAWNELVAEGGMDEIELAETLVEQLDGSTQGWDGSMEDAEAHPELAELVGLDPEADPQTDPELERWEAAAEAWGRVVAEAARRWLGGHPEAAEAARDEMGAEEAPTPEEQHEAALAALDRAEAMAAELEDAGLAELAEMALELAEAARRMAAEMGEAGQRG